MRPFPTTGACLTFFHSQTLLTKPGLAHKSSCPIRRYSWHLWDFSWLEALLHHPRCWVLCLQREVEGLVVVVVGGTARITDNLGLVGNELTRQRRVAVER